MISWRLITNFMNDMKHSPYSQNDQDIWVLKQLNNKVKGFFIEVGAFQRIDGYMSNTLFLEEQYKWSGILIEPNKNTFKNLKNRTALKLNIAASNHNGYLNFKHAIRACNSMVSANGDKTQCLTLDRILQQNKAPKIIDFLSVDVEGHELNVLEGIDFSIHHVNCAVIEYVHQGIVNPDLEDIKNIMTKAGFIIKQKTGYDLYFKNTNQQ